MRSRNFSKFPELDTEYRIKKYKNRWFLQFKDHYRIFGIPTMLTVWRFIPSYSEMRRFKRKDCPYKMPNYKAPECFPYIRSRFYQAVKAYALEYPSIEVYFSELKERYQDEKQQEITYL